MSDRDQPTVSVCLPVYNGAEYIEQAVQSVLEQTYPDFELVVLDNASEDSTVSIVESFDDPRIRLVRNPRNIGLAPNWDRALAEARGGYVKIMTHDDLLYPSCLEMQVRALDEYPSASLAAVKRDVIDEAGRFIKRNHGLRGLKGLVAGPKAIRRIARSGGNPLGESVGVLLRTSVAQDLGPFDSSRPYVVDIDYWVRAVRHNAMVALEETLAAFRVSPNSLSVEVVRLQGEQVRGFVRSLRDVFPDVITWMDVAMGLLSATVKAYARRALYVTLRLQGAKRSILERR